MVSSSEFFEPAQVEALKRIGSIAGDMKTFLARLQRSRGQAFPPPSKYVDSSLIPELTLPSPHDILATVPMPSIPATVAARICEKVAFWIDKTQKIHREQFEKACTRIMAEAPTDPRNVFDRLKGVYESLYTTRYMPDIKTAVTSAIEEYQASKPSTKRKPAFNYEYTPLLEKYFEYNAYPSAKDRSVLARKSKMESKQIEVWFQNHRNRARKDGRKLMRLSEHPLPVDLALESLEHTIPHLVASRHYREPAVSMNREDHFALCTPPPEPMPLPAHFHPVDFTPAEAPAHAFPTPYTPSHAFVQSIFPTPEWPRVAKRSSSSKSKSDFEFNIDELVQLFSHKLRIFDDAKTKKSSRRVPRAHKPWNSSTVTRLPAGRHPGLIPPTHTPKASSSARSTGPTRSSRTSRRVDVYDHRRRPGLPTPFPSPSSARSPSVASTASPYSPSLFEYSRSPSPPSHFTAFQSTSGPLRFNDPTLLPPSPSSSTSSNLAQATLERIIPSYVQNLASHPPSSSSLFSTFNHTMLAPPVY